MIDNIYDKIITKLRNSSLLYTTNLSISSLGGKHIFAATVLSRLYPRHCGDAI